MKAMDEALELKRAEARKTRRGPGRQRRRRTLEGMARKRAVAFGRWAKRRGLTAEDAVNLLCLAERTLREWEAKWVAHRLRAVPRGRKLERLSMESRSWVIGLLLFLGPQVGLRPLKRGLPGVARGELVDLQERYRRVYARLCPSVAHRLTWTVPGAVWAMDHTRTPCLVDGEWTSALGVRDLASGETVGMVPQDESAEAVITALEKLFVRDGAPLVLKADNGSAFKAEETRRFLEGRGVHLLLSPPRTPRYNGAVESGHRHLKVQAAHLARLAGRPGAWTWEDLEVARMLRNVLSFPRGQGNRSAEEVWRSRQPIPTDLRASFHQSVQEEAIVERKARGIAAEDALDRNTSEEINRAATGRALVAHGILMVRRRVISPSHHASFSAKIS